MTGPAFAVYPVQLLILPTTQPPKLDLTLPDFQGPYELTNGLCDHGHPVNGFGRCEALNFKAGIDQGKS